MKKVIFLFMVSVFSMVAMAQSSLYIYKTDGSAISYTIATVDSISFNATQDSLYINQSGTTRSPYKVATIDSISFTHPGVLINGVYWASRNVATPGTFTTNAEYFGLCYQWNSKVGWATTGELIATDGTTTWNDSWNGGFTTPSATDTWSSTNDPSPTGYRVPTFSETYALCDATKVTHTWTTQNSIYGEKFTDIATGNSIFLPASIYLSGYGGTRKAAGEYGYYWNSTTYNSLGAYYLYFSNTNTNSGSLFGRASGFSVRPVAK